MSEDSDFSGERPSGPPEGDAPPSFGEESPFDQGGSFEGGNFEGQDPFSQESFAQGGTASSVGARLSVAYNVGRMWIRDHQQTAMLSAFAAGVALGAYLRD